jgi:hypothetical protein
MGGVLVGQGEHANSEYSRPQQLVEDELRSFDGIPPLLIRGLNAAQQCPRPQSSQEGSNELSSDIQLEFIMPVFDIGSNGNVGIDVATCDFPSETDCQEERCGYDDVRRDMQTGGA